MLVSFITVIKNFIQGESPHNDNKLVYSSTVIQMFTFLYQNCPNFCNLCHTEEFITYLFCVLVPLDVMELSTVKDESSLSPPFYDMHAGMSFRI